MAVVTLFMSDRDPNKTFTNKKDADLYDKKLELAENVRLWMEREVPGLSEEQSENIGLLIAENKDMLLKAFKSNPEVILESQTESSSEENVTPIAANIS